MRSCMQNRGFILECLTDRQSFTEIQRMKRNVWRVLRNEAIKKVSRKFTDIR